MNAETNAPKTPAGRVTLPAEAGQEATVIELARRWGADAIRDSDGTRLSPELLALDYPVYSTICLVRADQEYPRTHPDQLPQKFLMSRAVTAAADTVEIDPMETYYRQKYTLDLVHDPKQWWQVIDRTTGEEVPPGQWSVCRESGRVRIEGIVPWHAYTVNFLVFQIWDTTSMYNHIQNNWTTPPVISVDPYHPETRAHLMGYFDRWLADHGDTRVVRLTTLAYHFCVDSDQDARDKFRDWTGYQDTVSIPALEAFARRFGYRLTAEDFVDQGYYNATYRVPSRRYLDWMGFIQEFTTGFGKALADKVHAAGKRAAIFWGDHWIGAEFYHPSFQRMGIDINIGACEDGVALRRLADTPGPQEKEIRLYPYFFPDVFHDGGEPTRESRDNWMKIRRALLRMPVDRIGYGGYLSLAARFPDFVEHVEQLCAEFREIRDHTQGERSLRLPVKAAVVNSWGWLRAWINYTNPHQKFLVKRPDVTVIAGSNMLECLAGLPVEVSFLSFDEIRCGGVPGDVDVLINAGTGGTAWSGGAEWADPAVVEPVRAWLAGGGGLVGITDPSGHLHQGRYFQLEDVLGVQKEVGQSCMAAARPLRLAESHFLTAEPLPGMALGDGLSFVYPASDQAQILSVSDGGHVLLSANESGGGRAVYLASLPYNLDNARLLLRALVWAARREAAMRAWVCDNPHTDCAVYPKAGLVAVVNHTGEAQHTVFFDGAGTRLAIDLAPHELRWLAYA